MTTLQVLVGGRALKLDRMIGKGGEGEVYTVSGDSSSAIKLYIPDLRLQRRDKVAAMVRCELFKRSPLAAFPVAVVQLRDGSFAGFLMKLMNGYRPIHELYAPGSRKHHFPQADYRFLARVATNIARAFASVHLTGCVVGDINHSGVFVSKDATAALIDADSFQFTDGQQQYLCSVGVPEYTPPELQSKPLAGVVRTTDHDAFGLAIVIFQMLLMGRHPFVGTVRRGDIPPLEENIKHFRYVYAENRDVGMDQPPGTPALSDFSPELAQLFDRAFSKGSVGHRPTAQEWVATLECFEANIVQCSDNPLHYGPKDASECAWCEMERRVGTLLFLPYVPTSAPLPPAVDPGKSFDVELIWARIVRVNIPSREQLRPKLPTLSLGPSTTAQEAKSTKDNSSAAGGVLLLILAGALLFLGSKAWPVAIAIGLWAGWLFKRGKTLSIDGAKFRNEFVDAQTQWYRELDGWRKRAGLNDVEALREQLQLAKQRYLELSGDEKRQIDEYRSKRRERQLLAYLEGFDLARASIKGIGHAKLATLASYGVDTAADVSSGRLQIVPGFGEALIGRLLEWRSKHASRFVYNASENDADRREGARIRALTESKAAPLRTTLVSGAQELELKTRRLQDFAQKEDPLLVKVHGRVEQAKADIAFLALPIPTVAPPSPSPTRRAAASPSPSSYSGPVYGAGRVSAPPSQPHRTAPMPVSVATNSSTPSCPRCGSQMRQRLARRGRNAGSNFWGCSRYPSCKGTRPI